MKALRHLIEDQSGIGLMEVLVSMFLLSVGVMGMGLLICTAIQGNVTSRDNTVVDTLIKRQIEHFESLDSLPTMPFEWAETGYGGVYDRTTYLYDNTTDTLIPADLCLLRVEVTWAGQDELTHTRSFSTYLMRP
jgi:Tfp pilus assembly protein PilV